MQDPTDRMSGVFGNNHANLFVNTPGGAFNSPFNSLERFRNQPCALARVPRSGRRHVRHDWLDGPRFHLSGIAGAADPSIVEDANQQITLFFLTLVRPLPRAPPHGRFMVRLEHGSERSPDANLQVLIMQVTTSGDISGQINYQVFPLGVGADQQQNQCGV